MTSKFYVYLYVDPITNDPLYVGKGKDQRYLHHLKAAKNGKELHRDFIIKLRQLLEIGDNPHILFLLENGTEAEAISLETEVIAVLGRRVAGTGPLYNVSPKGFKNACLPLTEDQKAALSRRWKGIPKSPEHAKKISEALKGRKRPDFKLTPEGLARKIEASKRPKSEETKKKMSEVQLRPDNPRRGRKWTDEQREALRPIRQNQPRFSKSYIVTTPEGKTLEIKNLSKWCSENGVSESSIRTTLRTGNPIRSGNFKGYKCSKLA